jgi:hypothetical protein
MISGCPVSGGIIVRIAGNGVAVSSVPGRGGSLFVENRIRRNPGIGSAGIGNAPLEVLRVTGR